MFIWEGSMAGQIKDLIDTYVYKLSGGDNFIEKSVHIRLAMQGIIHSCYDEASHDDPKIIDKLHTLAMQANIKL